MKAAVAEIIVIRDTESDDEPSDGQTTDAGFSLIAWNEVQRQLLRLANNPSLRKDNEAVATLLRDLGIISLLTNDVRCALQVACEKLGELLMLLRGYDRRYRLCEKLVILMCEVLSLAQTVPYQVREKKERLMKEEVVDVREVGPMDVAYRLMDKLGALLMQRARSRDGRSLAISSTMTRLETMGARCSREIERYQTSVVKHKREIESAVEEWAETMRQCRCDLESEWDEANEREWKVFDDTFRRTTTVQLKFEENNKGCKSLMHRLREKELCREFYRALTALVYAIALPPDMQGQEKQHREETSEEVTSLLGNDMLNYMETFCGALRDVMTLSSRQYRHACKQANDTATRNTGQARRAELVEFSKQFEAFWFINRSWLPPGMLDVVTRSFGALGGVGAHGKSATLNLTSECPLRNAICHVCFCLQADR
ncbi:unnamed protein product [Hyaloperonospora brassicae]|uniref:Uncharacterized protein n=1 Tax=Hyaloperonospora brassicae TaxID=162125 RepID=A0AAV0UV06_HYABA|nr:unnamed protein product [Hyaloperonospora brassicae]